MKNKRAAALALLGTLFLGVLQFIVLPALDYKNDMNRHAVRMYKTLNKTTALAEEYTQLQKKRKALSSGIPKDQGTLFAIIERISRKQGVNNLITSIRPQQHNLQNNLIEENVLIHFENMYQSDLVTFLYSIEKSLQGICVLSIEIKRTQNELLNASISLSMTNSNNL